MLQVQHICKEYKTGDLVQKALDDVSLNLRDNEFVAILGPSGSGKTTFLNMIGGLDKYDSGDLIINGISTKKYTDRDWDSYRNHTIGFIFQSYNLIPHQTLLSNVELALTISGISKNERRQRAKKALEEVGLGDQIHKKPSQLSGGQMQRVAIARALVNDPDILLADEPTGALDTDTSVQVMDLLKEVARDKLVVMVTHNPDLAQQYATRIVRIKDGRIQSDSDPYIVDEISEEDLVHRNMGKSSMSFPTALSLSFNNLLTKKARTILTAFAGSIGIIGIALILALSTGVNNYIADVEEDTLSGYPLTIMNTGINMTSLITGGEGSGRSSDEEEEDEERINIFAMITTMFSKMDSNDLAALKEYLDSGASGVEPYVNAVEYSYDIEPQIYLEKDDGSIRQVNPDSSFSSLGLGAGSTSSSLLSSMWSTNVFYKLPETSSLYENSYNVVAGRWPENYNELVLVLTSSGGMSDFMLYSLGLRDSDELDAMVEQFSNNEEITTPEDIGTYDYDDVMGLTFKLVYASDYYEYDEQYDLWRDKTDNTDYMNQLVADGEDLTIVGIVQLDPNSKSTALSSGVYYPSSLITHIAEEANNSPMVQDQLDNPHINVITGEPFGEESEEDSFDMNSMLTIDEDALADAFSFDTDAMSEAFDGSFDLSDAFSFDSSSMDLSGLNLDLSGISITLPDMGTIDMSEMLSGFTFDTSQVDLSGLVSDLLSGYLEYLGEDESQSADYASLGDYFFTYLTDTDSDAREIMEDGIIRILSDGDSVTIPTGSMGNLVSDLMGDYMKYLGSNGKDTSAAADLSVLTEYLATDSARNIMRTWIAENVDESDITISMEQLESLAVNLAQGYMNYADANDYPNPANLVTSFSDYMSTESARTILTAAVSGMVDTSAMQQQISATLGSYMTSMFSSFGTALGESLETQISSAMTQVMSQLTTQLADAMETAMTGMLEQIGESMSDAMGIDADAFADAFQFNMDSDDLTELMISMNTAASATYDSNLSNLGYIDFDEPSEINIYPIDFPSKDSVVAILDAYNDNMEASGHEEKVITYTDTVGTLMSSVTEIINLISDVLIAFVAISLVVSSIMIGVITYISVLERKKEIGILRAIGASKGNIAQVFNAETVIIGLAAGLIGIGLAYFGTIPGNFIIHTVSGNPRINMVLMPQYAVVLVILSVILTLIGGWIPSRKAAKSDPVTALRTD